ncbi:MAG: 50S ribosomal protein L21 [Prolixibacteraceae bacterium]|jgi:large subunit ribosomal protein L21|nr:50S ribosomal protein L21 [Prolixibacteraceae bacterium]MDI9562705.1 50S ribosomal protein L21 [Bacteroidota bacterium]NLS99650.1 50S ribosomal protein L21 [Bacteroidales bacterium]OQB81704.1 MAG: 50S ribosomal protein L21 [Bacteroidetes bacterium ADurb.Bin123]HNU77930.1 50S ribosomal protein L21 [Prolixibacteraceae bacterium]
MYAIVEIAGQQFKVEKDKKLFVHRLTADEGEALEFSKVLLINNDGDIRVGTPVVEGAKVTAKVLEHTRGDKVLIFKKKRRKGYQKLNGHRQSFTQVLIEEIVG